MLYFLVVNTVMETFFMLWNKFFLKAQIFVKYDRLIDKYLYKTESFLPLLKLKEIKFGHSEKNTNFEKIFHLFDAHAIDKVEDFFFYILLRMSKLYKLKIFLKTKQFVSIYLSYDTRNQYLWSCSRIRHVFPGAAT